MVEKRYHIKSDDMQVSKPLHELKVYVSYKEIDQYIQKHLDKEESERFGDCTFVPFKIEQMMDGLEISLMPVK